MGRPISPLNEENVRDAYREWEEAKNFFEYLSEPELVDYAAYAIEAAKLRFLYMLRRCKAQE